MKQLLEEIKQGIYHGTLLAEDVLGIVEEAKKDKQKDFSSYEIASKYGYEIVEDVKPTKLNITDLKFKTFLEKEEAYITGEEMRIRAITKKGNFGLVDGERWRVQMNNSKDKFKEWQRKYIVLPGTVLRYSDDNHLRVAYLDWSGGSWEFNFFRLDSVWVNVGWFACSE